MTIFFSIFAPDQRTTPYKKNKKKIKKNKKDVEQDRVRGYVIDEMFWTFKLNVAVSFILALNE